VLLPARAASLPRQWLPPPCAGAACRVCQGRLASPLPPSGDAGAGGACCCCCRCCCCCSSSVSCDADAGCCCCCCCCGCAGAAAAAAAAAAGGAALALDGAAQTRLVVAPAGSPGWAAAAASSQQPSCWPAGIVSATMWLPPDSNSRSSLYRGVLAGRRGSARLTSCPAGHGCCRWWWWCRLRRSAAAKQRGRRRARAWLVSAQAPAAGASARRAREAAPRAPCCACGAAQARTVCWPRACCARAPAVRPWSGSTSTSSFTRMSPSSVCLCDVMCVMCVCVCVRCVWCVCAVVRTTTTAGRFHAQRHSCACGSAWPQQQHSCSWGAAAAGAGRAALALPQHRRALATPGQQQSGRAQRCSRAAATQTASQPARWPPPHTPVARLVHGQARVAARQDVLQR
jgi:hypothetical protein